MKINLPDCHCETGFSQSWQSKMLHRASVKILDRDVVRKRTPRDDIFLVLIPILAILFFSQSAFAQETPDSIRFKTLGCIYNAIGEVNHRNVRLQALQHELEDMQPLAPQNMDSAHFAENLAKSTKYLLFLESHRRDLTSGTRKYVDSLRYYQTLMKQEDQKEAVEKFLTAYKEEAAAFMGYSQRLSLMVTDIRLAIVFLQTVPMSRKGNDITFNTDKSANEKYLDFQSKISSGQYAVDAAIEKTVKLSEKENKAIHEAMQVLNQ
jgi:hypothetical protein